jgi:hypothetical protein
MSFVGILLFQNLKWNLLKKIKGFFNTFLSFGLELDRYYLFVLWEVSSISGFLLPPSRDW